jgi:hypothetical protein
MSFQGPHTIVLLPSRLLAYFRFDVTDRNILVDLLSYLSLAHTILTFILTPSIL